MSHSRSLRTQLIVFSFLFAAGMWMSKVAQPMYFDDQGALLAFGVGYAVMAVVGGLSFAWGALADRLGGLNAVVWGGGIYAVGISGRVFTDLAPTIVFSIVAGTGASLALVGVRPWVRSRVTDDEIPAVVATRGLGSQLGVIAGTVGAAGLFAAAEPNGQGHIAALLVAPVLVLGGVLWLAAVNRTTRVSRGTGSAAVEPVVAPLARGLDRGVATRLAVLGLLSGFSVSLVAPYVPVILTGAGMSASNAALAVGVMAVAQLAATAVLARFPTSPRPYGLFVVAEGATAGLTLLAAAAVDLPGPVVAAVFVARSAFLALSAMAEEMIQYAVIPAAAAGVAFGAAQTAFLVGDALGGTVGAVLWQTVDAAGLLLIAGMITVVNVVLLPLLLRPQSRDVVHHAI